jgi:hypothetical protein
MEKLKLTETNKVETGDIKRSIHKESILAGQTVNSVNYCGDL